MKESIRKRQHHRAFSMLLEVVIGFGVFTTALLFLFGLFASSKKVQAGSKNFTIASELCRETLERELTKGYTGIIPMGPIPLQSIQSTVNGVTSNTDFDVTIEVNTITAAAATDGVERKEVTVVIGWDGVTGRRRKVELETIVVP